MLASIQDECDVKISFTFLFIGIALMMGLGQNFLTRVGLGQTSMVVWVKVWKISNFSIFCPSDQKKYLQVRTKSTRVKGGAASYLLRGQK